MRSHLPWGEPEVQILAPVVGNPGRPRLHRIKGVRIGILARVLITGEGIQSSTIRYDGRCGCFVDAFIKLAASFYS